MALGDPSACLRFLGEAFDSMLEIPLCDIAEAYSEITPEGGMDAVLTELYRAWGEVVEQLNMRKERRRRARLRRWRRPRIPRPRPPGRRP